MSSGQFRGQLLFFASIIGRDLDKNAGDVNSPRLRTAPKALMSRRHTKDLIEILAQVSQKRYFWN